MSESASMLPFDGELVLSTQLDYFQNGDEFFVHHNLFGYILKMSEDVIEFLEFFRGEPKDGEAALEHFEGRFSDDMVGEFANVLALQACLLEPGEDESARLRGAYPMHARFIVAHQPEDEDVTLYAFDHRTRSHVHQVSLDAWDSALWRAIDGETTVTELIEAMRELPESPTSGLEDRVFASLAHWTHCDLQVLKISAKPASTYQHRRHGTPPYLISSMPYERVTHMIRGEDPVMIMARGQKRIPLDDAVLERDIFENRLEYLFGEKHAALADDSYGGKMCRETHKNGLSASPRILEIGGSGALARGFMRKLASLDPARYSQAHYTVAVPSEILAEAARTALAGEPKADVIVADPAKLLDALTRDGEPPAFDVAIINEFAANLPAVKARRLESMSEPEEEFDEDDEDDDDDDDEERPPNEIRPEPKKRATYLGEGDAVSYILKYDLPLDDAPADFELNTGAFRLLEQLAKVTAEILLVEFGEFYRYPIRTVEDDGTEAWSIHWGHVTHVAKKLGFETKFGYLIEAFGFDREMQMLSTTRSQFKCLRLLFESVGATLERRAWSKDEFEAHREAAGLGGNNVIALEYEPLEDRVLGIVPHSLKIFRCYKKEDEDEVEL